MSGFLLESIVREQARRREELRACLSGEPATLQGVLSRFSEKYCEFEFHDLCDEFVRSLLCVCLVMDARGRQPSTWAIELCFGDPAREEWERLTIGGLEELRRRLPSEVGGLDAPTTYLRLR